MFEANVFPVHFGFLFIVCFIIIHHLGEADNAGAASVLIPVFIEALKKGW